MGRDTRQSKPIILTEARGGSMREEGVVTQMMESTMIEDMWAILQVDILTSTVRLFPFGRYLSSRAIIDGSGGS